MKGKKKKKKKTKVNLILSHVNHPFFILDLQHTHSIILFFKVFFFNVKKGSIWFKLIPGLLALDPCLKWRLSMLSEPTCNRVWWVCERIVFGANKKILLQSKEQR
jgi:hypothetical protein